MRIDTLEKFIEVAKNIHNGFYSYDNLNYKGTSKKGIITCPIHGDFEQRLSDHIHCKAGCIQCSGKKFRNRENVIEDCLKIHGDKYDFSKFEFYGRRKKSIVICNDCKKEFEITPFSLLQGQGCKKCGIKRAVEKNSHNTELFIEKARKIHGDIYDYSKTKYINSGKKVTIICKKHGEFHQTPGNHLSNHGCFKCMRENLELGNRKCLDELLSELREKYENILYDIEIFPEEQVEYDLHKIRVEYTCLKHGRRKSLVYRMLYNDSTCDRCKASSGEELVFRELKKHKIDIITEKTFDDCINPVTKNRLYFDFYLPEYNKCIEVDGQQHDSPIKFFGGEDAYKNLKFRDDIKNEYCKNNNIPLLRIKYKDINNIDKIIFDFLYG
jgi:hypothetical protein